MPPSDMSKPKLNSNANSSPNQVIINVNGHDWATGYSSSRERRKAAMAFSDLRTDSAQVSIPSTYGGDVYKKPKILNTLLGVVLLPQTVIDGVQHSIQLIPKHFVQLLGPAVVGKAGVDELVVDHHLVHQLFG